MISKRDLKALLNNESIEKRSTERVGQDIQREINQQQVKRNKIPLTVILCSEQMEHLYLSIKRSRSNTLLCPDVQYLNSVNHLSNVEMIILDCASFSNIEELGFLIGMFQLLHQNASILLVVNEPIEEGMKFKKLLKSEDRLYLIERENLDPNLEERMVACSSLKESPKQRKKLIIPRAGKIILICMLLLLAAGVSTGFAVFYIQNKMNTDVYDRNMNVQIDMGKNTIMPIKEVYSNAEGNHVIIEELTESESVKIRVYDNEQNIVSMDEQKITCPDKECNLHHVLTFRHDEDIPYYIIQLENESTVKNIEVDSRYFK